MDNCLLFQNETAKALENIGFFLLYFSTLKRPVVVLDKCPAPRPVKYYVEIFHFSPSTAWSSEKLSRAL